MLNGGIILHGGPDTLLVSVDVVKRFFDLLAGDVTSP